MLLTRLRLIVATPPLLAIYVFIRAREQARRSPEARKRLLGQGALGFVAGAVVAWGCWYVLPTNRESPGMLITYFVSWIIGGGAMLVSLGVLLGATFGRR
jgi:hypothetical protein